MVCWLLLATPWDYSDDFPIYSEPVYSLDTSIAGATAANARPVLGWVYLEARDDGLRSGMKPPTTIDMQLKFIYMSLRFMTVAAGATEDGSSAARTSCMART